MPFLHNVKVRSVWRPTQRKSKGIMFDRKFHPPTACTSLELPSKDLKGNELPHLGSVCEGVYVDS